MHGDAGVAADPGVAQAIERARVGGRPVPDRIRRRMENLTGAPLGGVRLHVDQGADRLNDTLRSRAFTVGADVFVRRSEYRPGTAGGDALLAHELTHAIHQGTAGPTSGYVQRRVGYEFETTSRDWKFLEKSGAGWQKKTDTKANLIPVPSSQGMAHANADNGNVEFVTEPLRTRAQVETAVSAIAKMYANLRSQSETTFTVQSDEYKIVTKKTDSKARPQATFGIQMRNIRTLIRQLVAMHEGVEPERRKRARRDSDDTALRRRIVGVKGEYPGFLVANYKVADRMFGKLPGSDSLSAAEAESVVGFLTVVLKTIAESAETKESEDPKYAYALMARTDFVSMLGTMPQPAQNFLAVAWQSGSGPLATALQKQLKDWKPDGNGLAGNLLGTRTDNVTIRAWIDSIFAPGASRNGRDLLSPPPGFPPHDTVNRRNEGMGALRADSTDQELAVFEMRDLGTDLEVGQYLPLALTIADLVGRATADPQLTASG